MTALFYRLLVGAAISAGSFALPSQSNAAVPFQYLIDAAN
jgi:hypothetical protein